MAQRPPLRPRGPSPRPGPSYGGTATARATFCRRRLPPGSATSRLRASASPRAERRPASTCGLRAAPPRAAFRGSGRPQPEIGPALGPAFGSRARAPARPWPAGRGAGAVPAFHHGGAVCWRSAAPRLRRGQRRRARSVPPRRDSGSAPEGSPRSAGPAVGRGRRGRDGGERRSPPWARWAVPGPAAVRGGQGAARGGGRCPSVHPSVCLSVSVW